MADTDFEEKLIQVKRTAKTHSGGKRFRFSALVVVGDRNGRVGLGLGKAREVPLAIQKANGIARRNLIEIPLANGSIPHEIVGEWGTSRVLLKPASAGTGVIAGSVGRAIAEMAGVTDILTKVMGSSNPYNVANAVLEGFGRLRVYKDVQRLKEQGAPGAHRPAYMAPAATVAEAAEEMPR